MVILKIILELRVQSAKILILFSENNVNVIGEDSSYDPSERRRTVVLGVTKNKKSKKSKKLAITFRYNKTRVCLEFGFIFVFTGTQKEMNCRKVS